MIEKTARQTSMNIVNQLFDIARVPSNVRQQINDKSDEFVLNMLSEYSSKESIDFVTWILRAGWNLFGDLDKRYWRLGYDAKTTEELFLMYKEEINGK